MADGRELIYFDETPHADRVLADPAGPARGDPGSQVRYDALLGEWVGIAGHRQTRTYHPPANACPLCPSTPTNQSEIPSPTYDVVVFENRFPSFAGAGDGRRGPTGRLLFDADRATAAARWCASPPTTTPRCPRLPPQPDADRHRGLGRPHRRAVRACRGRAGLLLREPRRGDRCHPGPPARPDLRLPLRHPEDRGRDPLRAGVPGPHRRQPVRRPAGRRARRRLPHRRRRTSTGWRSCRSPPAGRSRCTSTRGARSAT